MRVALRGTDRVVAAAVESAAAVEVVDESAADVVVAVDEAALLGLAADPPSAPVVPVSTGGTHHTVARGRVADALAAVAADGVRVVDHPIVAVDRSGSTVGRAVTDVTLMTNAPARISEYAVHADGERVEQVRADGIVAATPLGSAGYARNAGGPVLDAGTGLSVVPVAPFATLADSWVLSPPLAFTVERDEDDVSLYLDGDDAGAVTPDETVSLTVERSFPLVRVPPSASGDG